MVSFDLPAAMVIASGSLHAIVNAIVKGGHDRMGARAATDGASAVIMLPAIALVDTPGAAWPYLAGSAIVHGVYLYALVRCYDLADLSAVYPVLRGTAPMLTALIAIAILGEHAGAARIAGIVILGLGVSMLAIGRHLTPPALRWALLTGCCIAGYTVLDARGVRAAPDAATYIVWAFVLMGAVVVIEFALLTRGRVFAAMLAQWRPCAIAGVLSIATYGLALWAYALGPVAPLAALRETGTLTALVIAVVVLGERVTRQRAVAATAMVAGAALILASG